MSNTIEELKKKRFREVKGLGQGHTAGQSRVEVQSQSLIPQSMPLATLFPAGATPGIIPATHQSSEFLPLQPQPQD